MDRGTVRTMLLTLLGTSADDPAYSPTILDPLIQSSVDALLSDIQDANPDYLATSVTLTAASATSHLYSFAGQSAAITDFGKWIELRYTNETGIALAECRLDEQREFGSDYFTVLGTDDAPTIQTSADSPAGIALFLRYARWPAVLTGDGDVIEGVPTRYHDVVALETLFAFGLGGEQQRPPELTARWRDRRSQMLSRIGRRGAQPSRSRLVSTGEW